jgi:uncharacterized protein
MSAQENIELVRRGYDAFSSGNITTLNDLFAEDAVWHAAGRGVMSGSKQGRSYIMAYFGELMKRSEGTFNVDLVDLVGGEQRVVAVQHIHAEHQGKVFDEEDVNVFVVADGLVREVTEFSRDTGFAAMSADRAMHQGRGR